MNASEIRYYELRNVGVSKREWGRFLLTPDGMLLIYSSYGIYGHWWTHPGCEIRRFLTSDPDYVAGKFAGGKTEYDPEKTVESIKREILRLRRERQITVALAREERKLLSIHNNLEDESDIRGWYEETSLHSYLGMLSEYVVRVLPFQLQHFMRQVWPSFVERLKAELALEAQAEKP